MASSRDNKAVIERLIQCINDKKIEVMDELFHEDAVMEFVQSSERIIGGDNRRNVYKNLPVLPKITPKRILAAGDLVVAEVKTDYGPGSVYDSVFIFELSDGKISTEHAYWAGPIEAADWRSQWVEKIT
jgi:ketosteroid isomerase-like protein